jgi:hypothetical protein
MSRKLQAISFKVRVVNLVLLLQSLCPDEGFTQGARIVKKTGAEQTLNDDDDKCLDADRERRHATHER